MFTIEVQTIGLKVCGLQILKVNSSATLQKLVVLILMIPFTSVTVTILGVVAHEAPPRDQLQFHKPVTMRIKDAQR